MTHKDASGPAALVTLAALAALPSCEDREPLLTFLADDWAAGRYRDVEARTATLADAARALCDAPDAARLTAARDAWWAAREPFQRVQIVGFGPIDEYPLRLGPKMDDWPVNAEAVEELLASDAPLDAASFAARGGATRGFPVAEHLLYGPVDASVEPRRCEALVGVTADLAANATSLADDWEATWVPALTAPTPDGPWPDEDAVVDEWVNRLAFVLAEIRERKLGRPLDDPAALQSRASGRSLADARDALAGARDVWGRPGSMGIRDLVPDADVVAVTDAAFDVAEQRLADVPEPLEQAVAVEPEIVRRAMDALFAVERHVLVDVAPALDTTLTFDDNDGD